MYDDRSAVSHTWQILFMSTIWVAYLATANWTSSKMMIYIYVHICNIIYSLLAHSHLETSLTCTYFACNSILHLLIFLVEGQSQFNTYLYVLACLKYEFYFRLHCAFARTTMHTVFHRKQWIKLQPDTHTRCVHAEYFVRTTLAAACVLVPYRQCVKQLW